MGAMCPPERVNRCRTPSWARAWATRCPPCFGRSIVGYPIGPMPLFRRRDERPPSRAAQSRSSHLDDEDLDWRSFDSVAETYARLSAPNLAVVAKDLVDLLEVAPGQHV